MSNIGNISRRSFFKLALAGATVAASSSSPAVAALLRKTYADKIRHIMALRDKLLTYKTFAEQSGTEYNSTFNELLGFITDEFKVAQKGTEEYAEAAEAVRKIFHAKSTGETVGSWEDVPPTLPEGAIAIAVARDLLAINKLRLNPVGMPNFERFAETFQELILDV